MVAEGNDRIVEVLWQGKFYIALIFVVFIVIVTGSYYYLYAKGLEDKMVQKDSDYSELSDKYNKLSNDHAALVNSNEDLSNKYTDVTSQYNKLNMDNQDLKTSYNNLKSSSDDLNNKVNRLHETGGPAIALRYSFYEGGPSDNRKNYLEATVYNVGDKKQDKVTIKCQVVNSDNSTSISSESFDNVDALDKRHVKWDYSTSTHLGSVWYET